MKQPETEDEDVLDLTRLADNPTASYPVKLKLTYRGQVKPVLLDLGSEIELSEESDSDEKETTQTTDC